MKKLTIALLTLFVLLTVSALAQDIVLPDSVQTQILEFEAAGQFDKADALLRQTTAQAKLDIRQAEAQAKLEAKAKAEAAAKQAKISKKLNDILVPLPINECWPTAKAFADSNSHNESFVAITLAKRYHLEGNFETIGDVKDAYELRAAARKLRADMLAIANHGDLKLAKPMAMIVIKLDSLDQRVSKLETGLAAVTKLQNDHDGDIEALKSFIITTKSSDEVNKDSAERFQEALKQSKKD